MIGSTLAISGIAAYAIVQVPTIRVQVGQYFINTTLSDKQEVLIDEDYHLMKIAYRYIIPFLFLLVLKWDFFTISYHFLSVQK